MPKPRAAYGSGAKPYQRADGYWVARIEGGWSADGKRKRIVVSAKTEAECKRRLKAKQRELAQGREHGLSVRETVKSWAETWLPRHAQKVRPTTFTTDRGTVNKWIIPTLGHRRLADLTPADLRRLRDTITDAGLSTTTALHAHKTLLTMLKAAIVEGHHVPERVLLAPKPGKATNDRTSMSVDELLLVLEVISRRADQSRWLAAILTGTRRGETVGLTWDHIDLDRRRLEVSWQVQALPYAVTRDPSSGFRVPDGFEAKHLTGALHLTRPKTSSGYRVIPIVSWLAEALTVARENWEPNPWGLIWATTLRSGEQRPIRDDADRANWHAIQAEAGVAHPNGRPYHVHETRHSVVSLLLADGSDRSVIEAIVGQVTLIEAYVHVNTDAAAEALDRLAGRLRPARAIEA